ncbi:MAG: molybdate ABC transporter permease subunit [Actinobacteria bacterium]|nr:molybdate ABC transporter permease subunit [Actinomycetota bacterium]
MAALAFFAAASVALAFVVLPVVAIFVHVSPGTLVDQLSNPVVHDALLVTLRTSLAAQALIVLFGTSLAWLLATRRFPGRAVLVTLVELPIVLPPAVAGIGLLVAFGRFGLVGRHFGVWSALSFDWLAVTFAVMLVAGPFYVRSAIAAFESVDGDLLAASRTLGAGPVRTFLRVALPLARSGLAAGEAISLARGIGEFGATIMFAGSLQGRTQTLSLAVYSEFDRNFDVALAISALLVVISLAILLTLKASALWQPYRQTSAFLSARFASR